MDTRILSLKERAKLLWKIIGGKSFVPADLNPEMLYLGNMKSVYAMLSVLLKEGFLTRTKKRGRYDFTDKTKSSILADVQPEVQPEVQSETDVELWEKGGSPPLILSPEEEEAFSSLNTCQPSTVTVGPLREKQDRITEADIALHHLSPEGKNEFFKKMEMVGILKEEGSGKRGRIFRFNQERYLESCGKIQILVSAEKILIKLQGVLSDKEKMLEELLQFEGVLAAECEKTQKEKAWLQKRLKVLQQKLHKVSADANSKTSALERVRQAITSSTYKQEVERIKRVIKILESLAQLSEGEQWQLLKILCPGGLI